MLGLEGLLGPDVQAGFSKSGTRDQIASIHWIKENAREFQKKKKNYINFCIIDYAKAFDCVDGSQQTVGNS